MIEPGHIIRVTDNHIQKVDSSGKVLADFGKITHRHEKRPLLPENIKVGHKKAVQACPGWVTYASWSNDTEKPVSFFQTTWVVPPVPHDQSGQLFFFNGIQNATWIYQPVLQWGASGAGGGKYWAVASWYVSNQQALHTPVVRVNPGDNLVGTIILSSQSGKSFNYDCSFNLPNTILPIANVQELTWLVETLEAYAIDSCDCYPGPHQVGSPGIPVKMKLIDIRTALTHPTTIPWVSNGHGDCGQETSIKK